MIVQSGLNVLLVQSVKFLCDPPRCLAPKFVTQLANHLNQDTMARALLLDRVAGQDLVDFYFRPRALMCKRVNYLFFYVGKLLCCYEGARD
jgi:hypothetical protein